MGLDKVKSAIKYLEIDAKEHADRFSQTMFVSTRNILAIAKAFRELEQRAESAGAEVKHQLSVNTIVSRRHQEVIAQRDKALSQLSELALQEPVACKKRLVNYRSGVAHHWTYHGEVYRPSSGDIFRVEVVPLYEHPSPAAVPDGWKLVPVEPSWNMLSADGCSKHHEGQQCLHHENRKRIWIAMISAAPEPPSC